ncbi:MAG TPA: TetR/AcrR family transcriptional regulator [Actinomycetaceae bacterium]|nr:TetR/AcrR family transcriptional regulator [Actinomycetaceae bacterium]
MSMVSEPQGSTPRVVKAPGVRREEIVAAARVLFAEQGVTSTTFNDIARRVGITRGLVYHYFPEKSALVDYVLEERTAEFVRDLRVWDEAREVGDIDQAVVDCIALLRRHVPGRGRSGVDTLHPRIDDAELHMRFVDRAVDALVDTIITTTVADYAARHRIEIDHVRETFFVLIHGLIGLVRSHPDVPDAVLGDLVRQTLRLVPNDPATPLHTQLEGE